MDNYYQKTVDKLGASDQRSEGSQLLGQGQQDFVFIVDCVRQERYEFRPRSLNAQR